MREFFFAKSATNRRSQTIVQKFLTNEKNIFSAMYLPIEKKSLLRLRFCFKTIANLSKSYKFYVKSMQNNSWLASFLPSILYIFWKLIFSFPYGFHSLVRLIEFVPDKTLENWQIMKGYIEKNSPYRKKIAEFFNS